MTELTTHSLEPWTLAFSPDASRVFSGGDDAVLQALELSSSSVSSGRDSGDHLQDDDDDDKENDALSATLLWSDRKIHEAGVTSILPLANDLLVTGSYDDRIRLLSAPVLGRRKVLAELDLGGGVWRLKVLGVRYVDYTLFFSHVSFSIPFFLRFAWRDLSLSLSLSFSLLPRSHRMKAGEKRHKGNSEMDLTFALRVFKWVGPAVRAKLSHCLPACLSACMLCCVRGIIASDLHCILVGSSKRSPTGEKTSSRNLNPSHQH